ncbi:MAG TPA: DsbC family protein [Burkholderiales bacterium]|nr:DsbC family protein [Burkholderiales bacterium]
MTIATFFQKTLVLLSATAALVACGANASEAVIRKAFQEKAPEIKIEKVTKTKFGGLYEIYAPEWRTPIIYTDANGSFLIAGSVYDLKSGENMTGGRLSELTQIDFNALPFNLAFKVVKGTGARKLAVFSDPDCPFCKRLESELNKVSDVTIHYFLLPIDSLHPQAREKSKSIWCSPDRAKAWYDFMLRDVAPTAAATCDSPVDKLTEVGAKLRINGTPTIYFANGRKVPGAVPAADLEKMLTAATK